MTRLKKQHDSPQRRDKDFALVQGGINKLEHTINNKGPVEDCPESLTGVETLNQQIKITHMLDNKMVETRYSQNPVCSTTVQIEEIREIDILKELEFEDEWNAEDNEVELSNFNFEL